MSGVTRKGRVIILRKIREGIRIKPGSEAKFEIYTGIHKREGSPKIK